MGSREWWSRGGRGPGGDGVEGSRGGDIGAVGFGVIDGVSRCHSIDRLPKLVAASFYVLFYVMFFIFSLFMHCCLFCIPFHR